MILQAQLQLGDRGDDGAGFPPDLLEGRQRGGGGERLYIRGEFCISLGQQCAADGGQDPFRNGESEGAVIHRQSIAQKDGRAGTGGVCIQLKDGLGIAEFPAEILAEVGRILLAECAAGVKAAAGTKLSRASVTAV